MNYEDYKFSDKEMSLLTEIMGQDIDILERKGNIIFPFENLIQNLHEKLEQYDYELDLLEDEEEISISEKFLYFIINYYTIMDKDTKYLDKGIEKEECKAKIKILETIFNDGLDFYDDKPISMDRINPGLKIDNNILDDPLSSLEIELDRRLDILFKTNKDLNFFLDSIYIQRDNSLNIPSWDKFESLLLN